MRHAALASPTQARYLKDAASTILDLIAVAKVRLQNVKDIFTGTTSEFSQEDNDKHLNCLCNDAAVFIALVLRSYLGASTPQLRLSRELSDIIIGIIVYVAIFTFCMICISILLIDIIFCRTLHSAKQFVNGGIQMRRSKFRLVRRVKVAWDAPKMKVYRQQLAKGTLMFQVGIRVRILRRI